MPHEAGEQDRVEREAADITAALLRAARRAHEIARDTGTKVVVAVDGETVEMDPDPEMFDDLEAGPDGQVIGRGSLSAKKTEKWRTTGPVGG